MRPRLQKDWDAQQSYESGIWDAKAENRRKLGIGPPLRPTGDDVWRLEQRYEDD